MDGVFELEHVCVLDVSAGSGLVFDAGTLVVVADDGLMLSRYSTQGVPLHTTRLFAGELPTDAAARKQVKPDLEALVTVAGGLFAVPSGSKRGRTRGAWVDGDRVVEVDCAPLFEVLAQSTTRLNVEGAAVLGEHLVLLTRRTGREGDNRLVRLRLADTEAALRSAAPRLTPALVDDIVAVELGDVAGTPLGLTDATALPDGTLLFSAAAELTDDPVLDGPVHASVLGRLDSRGRVLASKRSAPTLKIEGVALADDGYVYAIADADDPTVPSPLVRVPLARVLDQAPNRAR